MPLADDAPEAPKPRRSPHVEELLDSLTPEDIEFARAGIEFARWLGTTGRFTKTLAKYGLALLGAVAAFEVGFGSVSRIWARLVAWWST